MNMYRETDACGKTVEEAIEKAVKELGAPDAKHIVTEVLEEGKKGFLGIGSVQAKVHAKYRIPGEEIAVEFIKGLCADMELDMTISVRDGDNDDKVIDIEGEGTGILIGHHGETLDSLQYLANLAANRKVEKEKREYVRVTVDVGGYRAKREETLRTLARRMADKVLKYKKSTMLEPMTPYERRIIHSEIQKIDGVSTNSIGSENNRKVVIFLSDTKTKKIPDDIDE